ncbi:MAG: glutamate 5-kinase [Spirochaetae bacterium HGW-Spirochaetae-7]|nr:MAG: glutamate 5-kinase [Spirochaetae bacterium HGW-Spirochaetae-7]
MTEAGGAGARTALASAKRVVIKIGTNTITRKTETPSRISDGPGDERTGIDVEYLHRVAAELADLVRSGRQVLLVTSGAVGMGARELGLSRKPKDMRTKQACAAIGQPLLMEEYRKAFCVFGLTAAQLLVTRDVWDRRSAYLNLRSTVEALLERRVVPVFNENDSVSTVEIAFGDNDQLSAYVASKIDAELLIILSDVDALYDADPRADPAARPIPYVRELAPEIMASAGGKGTEFSTGGMRTKLLAVGIARDAGCRVVIADGRAPGVISRILAGETVGTLFDADSGLKNRQRWIKNTRAQGVIQVDDGALAAMRANNSLLPRGVTGVTGSFERGAVVMVNDAAKLITNLSSGEIDEARGKRSIDSGGRTGGGKVVARPDDVVFLDE